MGTIKTREALKDALAHPERLLFDAEKVFEKFQDFAKDLMCNFQIEKGDKRYWMNEIEFYIYSDEHRDIITYPRNCPAGVWFFHPSGVDIAFSSNVTTRPHPKTGKQKAYLEDGALFGGILIRKIKLADQTAREVKGPLNVCDELFDQFNAFEKPAVFPRIIKAEAPREMNSRLPKSSKREGLNQKSKEKVHSILTNNYVDSIHLESELVEPYESFWPAKYRFYVD